jgi:hypothetical protein
MGLFGRRKPPSTDGLVLDRTWADRELDAAVLAVESGDLSTALAGLKQQTGDLDRRAVWNFGLGKAAVGRSEQLEAHLERLGPDPDLLVWLAQTLVLEGWEVRTAYVASQVSDQQFRTFHDILRTAREVVEAAIETAPDDPTPWTVYQWVAIGLGAELGVHGQLFKEAVARYPESYQAHVGHIHALAPKWYGNSVDELMDFAAEASGKARVGSVLGTVLADAAAESDLCIMSFSPDLSLPKRLAALNRFYNRWTDQLVASREKWLAPGRQREAPDLLAHNQYAEQFSNRRPELGRASADAMFGRVSSIPWAYSGDPLEVFAKKYRR